MPDNPGSPKMIRITPTDRRIFKALRLKTRPVEVGKSALFGVAVCDDGSQLTVGVEATDCYFRWRVVIDCKPAGKIYDVKTGVGEFAKFWPTLLRLLVGSIRVGGPGSLTYVHLGDVEEV